MNLDRDESSDLLPALQGFEVLTGRWYITIEGRFDSAHYLYRYFPDGSNEPMHGHTWNVVLSISEKKGGIGKDGISFDFLEARKRLQQLIDRIDHICINDLPEFKDVNPTAENVARWFYSGMKQKIESADGLIREVRIHEGPGNVAVFEPDHSS